MFKSSNIKQNNESNKTSIDLKSVNNIIRIIFYDSSLKVLDYSLSPLSNKRFEFSASYQQLKITIQRKNLRSSVSFFVKSLVTDPAVSFDCLNKELNFYNKILPWLYDNYKGSRWAPVCYMIKNNDLIMEDLKSNGYRKRHKIFNEFVYLKSALATVARFHSCSILAETELKQLSENHVTLRECYPDVLIEDTTTAQQWMVAVTESTAAVAEKIGLNTRIIYKAFEEGFDLVKPSAKYCNVISHGKLCASNFMFDATKPIPKSVLVNFNNIKYVPCISDVLQLLYLNTTRSYREHHEKTLIEFYHTILEENVRYNDTTKTAKIPALEEVLKAYEDLRLYGCLMANIYYPEILFYPEMIEKQKENSKGFKNFLFHNRADIVLNAMKKDQFYKNKVIESVTELVELAAHL